LHRAGSVWIGLNPDRFDRRRPSRGLELSPTPRSPIVWRYRDPDDGSQGRLLNVVGWLNGGMVSVSTRGTLYLHQGGGTDLALYLPEAPKDIELGPKPPKVLSPQGRKKPRVPPQWPKEAVPQVIRHRFRTILLLNEDLLLDELRDSPA